MDTFPSRPAAASPRLDHLVIVAGHAVPDAEDEDAWLLGSWQIQAEGTREAIPFPRTQSHARGRVCVSGSHSRTLPGQQKPQLPDHHRGFSSSPLLQRVRRVAFSSHLHTRRCAIHKGPPLDTVTLLFLRLLTSRNIVHWHALFLFLHLLAATPPRTPRRPKASCTCASRAPRASSCPPAVPPRDN